MRMQEEEEERKWQAGDYNKCVRLRKRIPIARAREKPYAISFMCCLFFLSHSCTERNIILQNTTTDGNM